jgi:2-C-methyl-D-erythritol 4-phosphate cytidylyltransferase
MTNLIKGKAVIIVAGGSGKRMGTDVPKQFLLIKGKPILMHTIETFYRYSSDIQIVVVLPYAQLHQWEALKKKYSFAIEHQIVDGGSERFFSVRNGLKLVEKGRLVAVHDGVRPLVSLNTIKRRCQ